MNDPADNTQQRDLVDGFNQRGEPTVTAVGSQLETRNMANKKKKLSDILSEGERKAYFAEWQKVKRAGDYILPKGEYVALWIEGYAHEAKTGTKGIKLVFEIAEGEQAGRKMFHDLWLTAAAKPQNARDLDELGVTDPDSQLDGPIPRGVVVSLTVTAQKDDDGIERNRVRRIKFLRIEKSDAFEPTEADAVDTSFDPTTFDKPKEPATDGELFPMPTNGELFPRTPNSAGPYEKGGERKC